ncbi:MAG: histone deacetylase [Bacteroidota bacterium]
MLRIFHSDRYVPALPEGHRFPIGKYQLIREQLLFEGSAREEQLIESEPVAEADILRAHHPVYWQKVRDLGLSPREARKTGFPQSSSLVDRSRRSVQGTLSAALSALEHGAGMNIAGGTHHAYAQHGEGFCLLNDFAITAHHLLHHRLVNQILIVDLDVHQGNGNAHIFQDEKRVFTFSMHGQDNYPLRKESSDLDIGLPKDTDDNAYLALLQQTLPKLINQVRPDIIFFQAGVDVLATDTLGKLALSRQGCRQRDEILLSHCHERQIPVVVAMGGGYSARLVDTVEAHSNTFRTALDMFG